MHGPRHLPAFPQISGRQAVRGPQSGHDPCHEQHRWRPALAIDQRSAHPNARGAEDCVPPRDIGAFIMRRSTRRLAALGAAVAIGASGAALAAPAAVSGASTTPDTVTAIPALTGVGTTLTLNAGTAAALTSLGVKVAPEGTATASGSSVTFPITSGYVEIHSNKHHRPGYIEGSIEHYGSGLTLTAGTTTVTLSDFVVDPGDSLLYASVNGVPDKAPLLQLDGRKVAVSKDGSGDVVLNGTVANLTAPRPRRWTRRSAPRRSRVAPPSGRCTSWPRAAPTRTRARSPRSPGSRARPRWTSTPPPRPH